MRGIRTPRVILVVVLAVASLGQVVSAQSGTPPPLEPVPETAALAPRLDGETSVRFSIAPVRPDDRDLTVLTRWRSCGYPWVLSWEWDRDDPRLRAPATVSVVSDEEAVRVRVDVVAGPMGAPCEAETLVRLPIELDQPLGDRPIRDAADDGYEPTINLVDAAETWLTYDCRFGGGSDLSVMDLLGPGLLPPPGMAAADVASFRLVEVAGDSAFAMGPIRPGGRAVSKGFGWQPSSGRWNAVFTHDCDLFASSTMNQATATWKLRGPRPKADARAITVWVREEVCNGRPVYGRVAQPMIIDVPDGIVFVASTMEDNVEPDGTAIEDPHEYYEGEPGMASATTGSSALVDCPGLPAAPYTFNLYRRLGDQKLFDGSRFPPQERRRTRGDR